MSKKVKRGRQIPAVNARQKAPEVKDTGGDARSVDVQGTRLDAEMARKAMILSEIIGSPVSKRRRIK